MILASLISILIILIPALVLVAFTAEDLSNDCVLCRILTGALIGAIEAYPEAKARAEREKKIREAAYAKGNRDGRRACRNGILC